VSIARVGRPVDVQHLELHRLANGEVAGKNLRGRPRLVVCLVGYHRRAQHEALFERFDLKAATITPHSGARGFSTA
jgi:hypothetical protein